MKSDVRIATRKLSRSLCAALVLVATCGPAFAQQERTVTVNLTPPDAQFLVRHIGGGSLPEGPASDALLPSGTAVKASAVNGERGIIVTVHAPGYKDYEQKFPLAVNKDYWVGAAQGGWEIPLELSPEGLVSSVRHELRFHPLVPLGLLGLVAGSALFMVQNARRRAKLAEAGASSTERAVKHASAELLAQTACKSNITGQQIGDYQLLGKLGEGNFANVYLASQQESGRHYALKLVKDGKYDGKLALRFRREFEIGQTLTHRNLLNLYSCGEHQGAPYMVMDYVQGQSFEQVLAAGPLSLEQGLNYFRQMCSGVAYAHARGIIHRDLKPQNMILTDEGVLKILDFGMAKPINDVQKLTRTGDIVGTPSYMAPEQLMGDSELRSDIYALGVILHQLLTNHLPFEGGTPMDIISAHITQPAPSLKARVNVPAAIDELYLSMMEKEPTQRIQSVTEVLRNLDAALSQPAVKPLGRPISQRIAVPTEFCRA